MSPYSDSKLVCADLISARLEWNVIFYAESKWLESGNSRWPWKLCE